MFIFNKFTRVSLCLALCALLLLPSFLAPKRAQAIAPAIPVIVAVGSVVATSLAAYGVYSVSSSHTTNDVGMDMVNWVSKKLDEGGQVATLLAAQGIYTVDQFTSTCYSMFLDGYINLAVATYNVVNGVSGWFGELLQLYAADNFGFPSDTVSNVTIGDISFNTFYTDVTFNTITGDSPSWGDVPPLGYFATDSGDVYYISQNQNLRAPALLVDSSGGWVLASTNAGTYKPYVLTAVSVSGGVNRKVNSVSYPDVDVSSIHLNTYYSLFVYSCDNVSNIVSSNNVNARANSLLASYDQVSDVWTGADSSTSAPDNIDYGLWGDALSALGSISVLDALTRGIPVSSDFVYNPSLSNALENQGSIPIILDWSNIADWADVLDATRAGTIDGTRAIDGTSATTAVNSATGELTGEIDLDLAVRTPHLSISPSSASIGGALDFAGYSMLDRFPFCTIRDMQAIGDIMNRPSRAPVFNLPVIVVDGGSLTVQSVPISLQDWEPVAVVLRVMIGLLVILGFLRVATRQLKVFNEE